MPDPAIREFFAERKEAWLKKTVKPSMAQEKVEELKKECEVKFSYEVWLPDAAKKAQGLAITTHPSKFTHSSTGIGLRNIKNSTFVSPIIYQGVYKPDGFLRAGNVSTQVDLTGNGAYLDLHLERLLLLEMSDGASLIEHIKNDTDLAKNFLSIESCEYDDMKSSFLSLDTSSKEVATSSKIKQVFFPVDTGYHQLSLLTNSGLLYELRKRVGYSKEVNEIRKLRKDNQYSEVGYPEIKNLTEIGFGGANPQNISALNVKSNGKASLLLSVPPQLEVRTVHFPKHDFFKESVRYWDGFDAFKKLHGIFTAGVDSVIPQKNLRSGRDARIDDLLDIVIGKMWAIRGMPDSQINMNHIRLPAFQKLWLLNDEVSVKQREQSEEWLDEVIAGIIGWILHGYQTVIKKPVVLAGEERNYIHTLVSARKEALR